MTVGVERKFRNLENRIMEDVVRRIKKTGQITSSADYQLNRYYILGNSTKDIEDIVKSAVGDDYPETFKLYDEVVEKQYTRSRELYEQVNEEFIPYEQNEQLQQLVNGLIQQSNDELYNIHPVQWDSWWIWAEAGRYFLHYRITIISIWIMPLWKLLPAPLITIRLSAAW